MGIRSMRTTGAVLASAALLGAAGCSSDSAHENDPRPPAVISVSASITPSRVTASPSEIGAGPITLVIANVTSNDQKVTLESADAPGSGPGTTRSTRSIEPSGTATINTNVEPGRYVVRVDGDAITAAEIEVGPSRESAQNELGIP